LLEEINRNSKDIGSDATEYIYIQDQPIAEYNPGSGNWSDYVFANGKRVAKADNFTDYLHMRVTIASAGGATGYGYVVPAPLKNYQVQLGDTLYMTQYQSGGRSGLDFSFSDSSHAASDTGFRDQNGYGSEQDGVSGFWHERIFSLDAYAGKYIAGINFIVDSTSPAGTWDAYFRNIVVVSHDGTVYPLYSEESSFPVTPWTYQFGVTARSFAVEHVAVTPSADNVAITTLFYHDDHLGTSRMITEGFGYPIWQGAFLPFGQEYNPQITTNHYKFTGKERDGESGSLTSGSDYFGARYYSSTMGRWMSPDWAEDPEPVPYADMNDPQSLNLYSYIRDNPLNGRDLDGHKCDPDTASTDKNGVVTINSNCYDWQDLTYLAVAVGHHYIPKEVWSKIDKASDAWRVLSKTTTGALKQPRLSNSYDKLHRGLNRQVRELVRKLERELGKSLEDFQRGDFEQLQESLESAGEDVAAFNERLEALEPEARTFGEALAGALEEAFPALTRAASATGEAATGAAESGLIPE